MRDGGASFLDAENDDMTDAAILATPDSSGAPFWRPSSLDDIYDLPDRTLRYFLAIREGWAHAANKAQSGGKQGSIGGKRLG